MLDKILANTMLEVSRAKASLPLEELRRRLPATPPASLREALDQPTVNIIAEIKYRSPSRGDFPCKIPPAKLARLYADSGAAALSVLTDERFFNGGLKNLDQARRELPQIPILRKDFILDPYQVVEAAVHGASAYLLIVACLSRDDLANLMARAADHQLDCLVEVHDERELETAVDAGARLIGVNNRNLKDFTVNVATAFRIARRLEGEQEFRLVAESGIEERSLILELRDAGYKGFLIGSAFMESTDPAAKLRQLLARDSREVSS